MKRGSYIFTLAIVLAGCKKPYSPPALIARGSYLVVEGVINTTGLTAIKLSRTVNVANKNAINPVTGATLTIEDSQNNIFPLSETSAGNYRSANNTFDISHKYRLRIKTIDNQQYLSDFEGVEPTPPIDSIGFNFNTITTGINVYVNTHDPNNNTHYYRWEYEETWQFHAKYFSNYISDGTEIIDRPQSEDIYSCFTGDTSSNIVLGSSAKLKQDIIYQNTIITIPSTSEKIETKYSILLRQYALTGEAYNFWVNLKKNTEQLGSIFDPEPSNINGNIHNVSNPAEAVIGYISACTVQSKRIFITSAQLPQTWQTTYPYTCETDSIFVVDKEGYHQVQAILVPLPNTEIPISAFPDPFHLKGYISAEVDCVDCTIRGTKVQPAFWK
jgi:hypothetical protein